MGVTQLVYVTVAQPAPIMRAYLAVRAAGERMIKEAGLTATVLRPWYVLGPGHRWAMILVPLYKIAELVPATRETAKRLGLVTIEQMLGALVCGRKSAAERTGSNSRRGRDSKRRPVMVWNSNSAATGLRGDRFV
jgi:uncharacterized protein YbjT (DUF2867 family)